MSSTFDQSIKAEVKTFLFSLQPALLSKIMSFLCSQCPEESREIEYDEDIERCSSKCILLPIDEKLGGSDAFTCLTCKVMKHRRCEGSLSNMCNNCNFGDEEGEYLERFKMRIDETNQLKSDFMNEE